MTDIENNNSSKKLLSELKILRNNDEDHITMKAPDETLGEPSEFNENNPSMNSQDKISNANHEN